MYYTTCKGAMTCYEPADRWESLGRETRDDEKLFEKTTIKRLLSNLGMNMWEHTVFIYDTWTLLHLTSSWDLFLPLRDLEAGSRSQGDVLETDRDHRKNTFLEHNCWFIKL